MIRTYHTITGPSGLAHAVPSPPPATALAITPTVPVFNRPHALPVRFENVPPQIAPLKRWVVWRYEYDPESGKWKKPPYDPRTGTPASHSDPDTWGTLQQARAAYKSGDYDGVGIALGDGLAGLDQDDCVENGQLSHSAQGAVYLLNSYTEYSPTGGSGVKTLCLGSLPPGGRRDDSRGIELYDTARYFTFTGHHLASSPPTVEERTAELAQLHHALFPPTSPATPRSSVTHALTEDDQTVLEKARNAANGAKFRALYDAGDLTGYQGDQSRADLALCNMLSYWTNGNRAQTDRLFRGSALMREKWDETHSSAGATYGELTLDEAIGATAPRPRRGIDAASAVEADVLLQARLAQLERENARLRAERNAMQEALRHKGYNSSQRVIFVNLLLDAEPTGDGWRRCEDATLENLAERWALGRSTVQNGLKKFIEAETVERLESKSWEYPDGTPRPNPITEHVALVVADVERLQLPGELPETTRDQVTRDQAAETRRWAQKGRELYCPHCGEQGLTAVCKHCGCKVDPDEENQVDTSGDTGEKYQTDTPLGNTPYQLDTFQETTPVDVSSVPTGVCEVEPAHPQPPPPVETKDTAVITEPCDEYQVDTPGSRKPPGARIREALARQDIPKARALLGEVTSKQDRVTLSEEIAAVAWECLTGHRAA